MKNLSTLSLLLLFAFLLVPQDAAAQVEVEETVLKLGPRLTIDAGDISDVATVAIGADVRLQTPAFPVQGNGSFDFYFADDPYTVWTVDLNAVYPFVIEDQAFLPYAGAGLGITRISVDVEDEFASFSGSDTDIGLNLVGGAEFVMDNGIRPFAQLQATVAGDADRLGITGGVLFDI